MGILIKTNKSKFYCYIDDNLYIIKANNRFLSHTEPGKAQLHPSVFDAIKKTISK